MAKQIQFKGSASSPGFRPEQVGNQEIANMQRESNRVANIMRASAESEINELKRQAGAISNNQEAEGAARRKNDQITTNNSTKAAQQLRFDAESARQQLEANQAATRNTFKAISTFSKSALDQMQKLDEERFERDRLALYDKYLANPDLEKLVNQIRGEGELKATDAERNALIDAAVASGQIDELTGQQLKSMSSGARLGLEQARGVHKLTTVYQQKLLAAEAEMAAMTPPQKAAFLVKFRQEFLANPENGIDGRALMYLKPELLRTGLESTNQLHQSILSESRKTHAKHLREQTVIDGIATLTQNPGQFAANIGPVWQRLLAAVGPEKAHDLYNSLYKMKNANGEPTFDPRVLGSATGIAPNGKTYAQEWPNRHATGLNDLESERQSTIQQLADADALAYKEAERNTLRNLQDNPSQAAADFAVKTMLDKYGKVPQSILQFQKSYTYEAKAKARRIEQLLAIPIGYIDQKDVDDLAALDPIAGRKLQARYAQQESRWQSDAWKKAIKAQQSRARGISSYGLEKKPTTASNQLERHMQTELRIRVNEAMMGADPSQFAVTVNSVNKELMAEIDAGKLDPQSRWRIKTNPGRDPTYPGLDELDAAPTPEQGRKIREALDAELAPLAGDDAALEEWLAKEGNIVTAKQAAYISKTHGASNFVIPERIQHIARRTNKDPFVLMQQAMKNRGLPKLQLPQVLTDAQKHLSPEEMQVLGDGISGPLKKLRTIQQGYARSTNNYSAYTLPQNIRPHLREYVLGIGRNEGTIDADGKPTDAYFGHPDPGDKNWNIGTYSYSTRRHGADPNMTPEEADAIYTPNLHRAEDEYAPKLEAMGYVKGTREYDLAMFNILDLAVQAPAAIPHFVDTGLRNLAGMQLTEQNLGDARAYAFFTEDGRLDAPGFGNNFEELRADQQRRAYRNLPQ